MAKHCDLTKAVSSRWSLELGQKDVIVRQTVFTVCAAAGCEQACCCAQALSRASAAASRGTTGRLLSGSLHVL